MFTFMNTARIGTAIQGICIAEQALQGSVPYAMERRSMRALSGKKEPDKVADALIWHPDVRRMLLTQKAIVEGARAMVYSAAQIADHLFASINTGDKPAHDRYDDQLGFFTPILKGFLTELGLEAASLGMQVYGGHGYIAEHGMEQIYRDARIATLYEGTTGIQALDLLGRKVLLATKGRCVRDYTRTVLNFAKGHIFSSGPVGSMARALVRRSVQWNWMTTRIMLRSVKDREQVGSSSVDYLMYCGYVMMAFQWAQQAAKAQNLLASGAGKESADFYTAKIQTAEFYFARLLPRADAHYQGAMATTASVMQMKAQNFISA
jgi:hypothetical protein